MKRSEKESFLYEVPACTEVEVVRRELVKIHNLRCKMNRLTAAVEQLALYGPMKLPEQQGLDDSTPLLEDYDVTTGETKKRSVQHGTNYRQDPSEKRTGDAPSEELAAVLNRTVEDAKALVSQRMVDMKKPITSTALESAMSNIRGAVMIVYPMGLPDYDDVRQILEEREAIEGAAVREK